MAFVAKSQVINDPNVTPRSVSDFTSIDVSSAFDVYLTQSSKSGVAVSATDAEAMDRIKTEVNGTKLKVWYDTKGVKKWGNGKLKLKVYISFNNIEKLVVSGACDVYFLNEVNLDKLDIHLSGASDIKGNSLNVSRMSFDMSGASDVTVGGKVGKLAIEASGASDFKGYELATDYCDIHCSGASGVYITVNKELSADLSGASDVYYKGEGNVSHVSSSGSSNITKKS